MVRIACVKTAVKEGKKGVGEGGRERGKEGRRERTVSVVGRCPMPAPRMLHQLEQDSRMSD